MNNEDDLIYSYEELEDLVIKYQNINNKLQQRIDKANKILRKILVVKRSDGNYGAVKNTTKQEVYKTICMLNEILETPDRVNYKILGDEDEKN